MTKTEITRLMLADDDGDDREMFSEALAALDPQIAYDEAKNGKQALNILETLKTEQPNVIFVDINMPVMNGWELLRRLKSEQLYTDIPVIVYSTSSQPTDKEIAHSLGALCFVTKPSSFKLIKGMLETVISHLQAKSIRDMCDHIHKILKG